MKKLHLTVLAAVMASLLGCTEKENPETLKILEFLDGSKTQTLNIPGEGQTQTIGIQAGVEWKVTPPETVPANIHITPMSGPAGTHEITLQVEENPGFDPIACDYQITDVNGNAILLKISQAAVADHFYFELFWEEEKNGGKRYETDVPWIAENTFLPNIETDVEWYAKGEGVKFLSISEGTGSAGMILCMEENPSNKPVDYEITFHRKDNDRLLGIMIIHQQGKPVEHQLKVNGKTGKHAYSFYTWFGKKVEVPLQCTPAADLSELSYTNEEENESLVAETSSGKVLVNYKGTELINDHRNTLKISDPNYPENYVDIDVYYRTVCWISNRKDDGTYTSEKPFYYVGGARENWSYSWPDNQGDKAKYFIAYYAKDEEEASMNIGSVPHIYTPDSYIPTSEYTLVSGEPSVLEITKADEKSYKLTIKEKVFQKVPITYTCGDYSQTFSVKLVF